MLLSLVQLVLDRLTLFLGRLTFFLGCLVLFLHRTELLFDAAEFGLQRLVVLFLSGLHLEYGVQYLGLHVVGGCALRGASIQPP